MLVKQKMFYVALAALFILSGIAHYTHLDSTLQFILCALAIVFAAGFLGKATENVAHYAGQRMGGFLNATFGNAAELIIAIFLVKSGHFEMVKASITGSIIGNMLLVLGLCLLVGGLRFKIQKFNTMMAGHNASLMLLAVIALFVPAMIVLSPADTKSFSLLIAGILIVAYLLWLYFSMVTHKDELSEVADDHGEPDWSMKRSIIYLILATGMVVFISEWLVGNIEVLTERFGWSPLFVGAFVIAIVGNAAEHSAAIILASKNKIGAAVEIAIGSSLQIALFVAPALIFISWLFGNTMDIIFTVPELVAIGVSVFIAKSISRDGQTNWFEGVLLIVVYIILAIAFYLI